MLIASDGQNAQYNPVLHHTSDLWHRVVAMQHVALSGTQGRTPQPEPEEQGRNRGRGEYQSIQGSPLVPQPPFPVLNGNNFPEVTYEKKG